MSRRARIASLFDRLGLTGAVLAARRVAPPLFLPILTYHRVRDDADRHPFDDGVIDATPDEFDRQMALLQREMTPLRAADLCAWAEGAPLPPNPVCVTFDDGYRDNLEIALPILERHGVPAIFFIATHYIGARRLFWWDRVAYLIKQSRAEEIVLDYPASLRLRRAGAARAVLRLIKDTPGLDLPRLLDGLAAAAGVAWDDALDRRFAEAQLMTWDEVRALRRRGMDVQSHTRTHRVLTTLSDAEIDDELAGSRADLERELGEPVRIVSYPIGKTIAHRPRIKDALARAGYTLGLTNGSGTNHLLAPFDRWDVRRLALDRGTPAAHFRGVLALPWLAP
jgi:peptidoglycan/xylan/chitin deacetylase (PgdA/CDA1 family)